MREPTSQDTMRFIVCASVFFFLWFAGLFLFFASNGIGKREEEYIYVLFFLSIPFSAILGIAWTGGEGGVRGHASLGTKTTTALSIVLPTAIFAWGLKGIQAPLYHTEFEIPAFSSARFLIGVSAMLTICAALVLFSVKQTLIKVSGLWSKLSRLRVLGFSFGAGVIISLFDINITLDTLAYAPYVGPAAAVFYGAVPLVDVFSQYGFNFLIFSGAFKLLPWSMFSASVIVAALNVVYYIVVTLIVVKAARNRLRSFLLSVFVVMFLHAASFYNVTWTPSVLAMRFLPPLLVILALSCLPCDRLFTVASVVSLMLCSLWSLEACVFGALVYATYLSVVAIGGGWRGMRRVGVGFAGLAASMGGPHVALALAYLWLFGSLPEYRVYLELVLAQTGAEAGWELPISRAIRTWVLFGFGYALGLSYALYRSWYITAEGGRDLRRLAVVASVCALGILQFSYYIGRSATTVLVFIAFPLAILFVLTLDAACSNVQASGPQSPPLLVAGALGVVVLVGMGGVFADRFFRPMTTLGSNSTVLRVCLAKDRSQACSPLRIVSTLRRKIQPATGFPTNEAGGSLSTREESRAAYELIERWQKNEKEALLFITDTAAVLFLTKKLHRLGLAHSMVDGLSRTLVRRVKERLAAIGPGTVLIVGDTTRSKIDQDVVAALGERWTFCPLETIGIVTAYALKPKTLTTCGTVGSSEVPDRHRRYDFRETVTP